ncbi:MAG: cytochrome b N-terminal domain-containing protein [Pirellulales bacterium]|nr:cytochrome b N-terminal domain-containing protein [Pirellulales bacterium]
MKDLVTKISDWLDDRTGLRKIVHEALYERVPGGARWRYVWGSTLVVAFATQAITGIFLWMAYSPSTQTAWESVYYIQHEMTGGWLLRGIHHFMSHAMVVLLGIHLLQVVIDGAYRAPREINYVLGMVLMLIVLAMALTGYLLPWDQKGYWATKVSTELASQAPVAGNVVKKLAVGGTDYGHHTLTRFFALHAGLLPALLVAVLALHLTLFRRHGLHAKQPKRSPDAMFWPDQLLKDGVAALAVLVVVLALTLYFGGAELTAPADPANPYAAARPETYFLFLFQFLKWFPGELEVWGAIVIPTAVLAVLFLLPWIGRSRQGHTLNVVLLVLLLGGAALLTAQALHEDYYASFVSKEELRQPNNEEAVAKYEASRRFLDAKTEAHYDAQRVIELAQSPNKIPPTGALSLVYDDPYLQGPKLYQQHCAGCHNYADAENSDPRLAYLVNENPTAPNLFGVGSRKWIAGLLDPEQIAGPDYFGYHGSPFVGDGDNTDMVDFIQECFGEDLEPEQRKKIEAAMQKISVALSAEAQLPLQAQADQQDEKTIAAGRALMEGGLADLLESGMSCTDCHSFGQQQDVGSPILDGYMSRAWLMDFIRNPAEERFYGDVNDRMPAFAPHDDPRLNQLDEKSLGLIVDWLRSDWYRP